MNCAGLVIEMTPAQVHMHFDVLLRAGKLLINTVGEPGVQGAGTTGRQGIGVNTPRAAAVADATAGLAREVQTPKGGILARGIWSIMVAARGPPAITGGPLGITIKELGATPKEHCIRAPLDTCKAITYFLKV